MGAEVSWSKSYFSFFLVLNFPILSLYPQRPQQIIFSNLFPPPSLSIMNEAKVVFIPVT